MDDDLREAYASSYQEFAGYLKQKASTDFQKMRPTVESLAARIERLDLFSANETLDDYPTGDLKYIFIPFMLAKIYSSLPEAGAVDMDSYAPERQRYLDQAIRFYFVFYNRCERLQLPMRPEDKAFWETRGDPPKSSDLIRQDKISRSQFTRQISKDLGDLHLNFPNDEEAERDQILQVARYFVALSCEDLQLLEQEVELLEFHKNRPTNTDMSTRVDQEIPQKKPWFVTFESKEDVVNWYKERVFQPHYELPTVSLGDYVQQEWDEALAKDAQTKAQAQANERSDSESQEEDVYEKRRHDDFVEANPKGWGNSKKRVG